MRISVKLHPFTVHGPSGFHARFTNLPCAAHHALFLAGLNLTKKQVYRVFNEATNQTHNYSELVMLSNGYMSASIERTA